MVDRKWLGNQIKVLRTKGGLSQKKLEGLSGVSERSIQDIEGAKANPTLEAIEALEGAFGVQLIKAAIDEPKTSASSGERVARPLDIRDAAELLAKFSDLPAPFQRVILALVHRDAKLVRGLPEKTHKAVVALISAR